MAIRPPFSSWEDGPWFDPVVSRSHSLFEDMRDGMLASAFAAGDQCLIWQGFAKFGIGDGASGTARGKRVTISESFELPTECK